MIPTTALATIEKETFLTLGSPADNWKVVTPKLVFCRWRDGFNAPCSARSPVWIQKLCGDISRSSEEQQSKPSTIAVAT